MVSQNIYLHRNTLSNTFPKKDYRNNRIISINGEQSSDKKIISLMPSKFQNSDGDSTFSQGRNIFLKTASSIPTNNFELSKHYNCSINCKSYNCNCLDKKGTCSQGKYIPVQSSDQHIQKLKNNAIGSGTIAKYSDGKYTASFSGQYNNSINYQNTKQALRRTRNRGYVVPPKVVNNSNRNVPGTCL